MKTAAFSGMTMMAGLAIGYAVQGMEPVGVFAFGVVLVFAAALAGSALSNDS